MFRGANMTVWNNCRATILYNDGSAVEHNRHYQVRIDDDSIVVSYETNGNGLGVWVNYQGHDTGNGHYRLTAQHMQGFGTLHRAEDDYLEGYWSQDGQTGMWRIKLIP